MFSEIKDDFFWQTVNEAFMDTGMSTVTISVDILICRNLNPKILHICLPKINNNFPFQEQRYRSLSAFKKSR